VRPLTRDQLDLTDATAVRRELAGDRPGLVIHCAALSRSPACDADPALARRLNVEVTHLLAELCVDVPLVFFSTDLVFDGRRGHYAETEAPNPLSVYAETKAAAERFVLANPRHVVIRSSLNGGTSPTGDRGFNEQMRRAWAAGETLALFTDEFRSPIHAMLTARAVWELARQGVAGIWHVAGAERLSRFQIGELLAARWPHLLPALRAGSLRDYPGGPRPPDTSLDCNRAQARLSFKLAGLGEWLRTNPAAPF
jgi:dTDP-4-dehydrorhamnose reductase